jgi:hypothetical protein
MHAPGQKAKRRMNMKLKVYKVVKVTTKKEVAVPCKQGKGYKGRPRCGGPGQSFYNGEKE